MNSLAPLTARPGNGGASLTDLARHGPLPGALAALCVRVSGRQGYLLGGRHAIAGLDDLPIIDGEGRAHAAGEIDPDPVLAHLGLRLVRVPGPAVPAPEDAALHALLLRIGLLGRMLDLAHAHLKERVSFGQRTLKHQLVKVVFAEAHGAMQLLKEKCRLRLENARLDDLHADHLELSQAEIQAEKLMGGHGYLIGGTHSIAYLSMLIAALHGGGEA